MKAFLFDMDGVLVDSEPVFLRPLCKYTAQYGVETTPKDMERYVGRSETYLAKDMVARYKLPVSAEELLAAFRKETQFLYACAPDLPLMPHVAELLAALKAQGAKTALVSSSKCYDILSVLNRFSLFPYFDAAVGLEHVDRPKPDPQPYQLAAQLIGAKAEDCVVVEDSPTGIQAGLAAGMHVIGFRGGSIVQDTAAATEEVDAFAQLIPQLRRFAGGV